MMFLISDDLRQWTKEKNITHCSGHDQDLRTQSLDCHQIHLKNQHFKNDLPT